MSLLCAPDLDGGLNETYSPTSELGDERPAAELHVSDKCVRQLDRSRSVSNC